MAILAIGSVASGFLFTSGDALVNWLQPVVNAEHHMHEGEALKPIVISAMALGVVALGVILAITKYRTVPVEAPTNVSIFTRAARKDLFQDSFNEAVFMRPGQALTKSLVKTDDKVIDGAVRGIAWSAITTAVGLKKLQNGYVRTYALTMVVGVVALVATIWVVTL
jgi:NADH-quinone oxidoreductase subunit L